MDENVKLNWVKQDYFPQLTSKNIKKSAEILELLVEDLHTSKERTLNAVLCYPLSKDILIGIFHLLTHKSPRVSGNTAYVLGTLVESEVGSIRVLDLITTASTNETKSQGTIHTMGGTSGDQKDEEPLPNVVDVLTRMLNLSDSESVMNAAGTLGTLAENSDGRDWILKQPIFSSLVDKLAHLLKSEDIWTASNAALVIARLTICEAGCTKLSTLPISESMIGQLISALGVDPAGRGMNAAFALGRLCDYSVGLETILKLPQRKQLVGRLFDMVRGSDPGSAKNGCFCLSCLAGSLDGHNLLVSSPLIDTIMEYLAQLVMAVDQEAAWFAGMTYRTLASQPKGVLKMRQSRAVIPALQKCIRNDLTADDLKQEAALTLSLLESIPKPDLPRAEVLGPHEVKILWDPVVLKTGFSVRYHLYKDETRIYDGEATSFVANRLLPFTQYAFKYKVVTEIEMSPFSDSVNATTEESTPSEPCNLRTLVVTTNQVKVVWEPPENNNGLLKHFMVFLDGKLRYKNNLTELMAEQHSRGERTYDTTQELSTIIAGLQPQTIYEISVCACTSKGKGPKASINVTTHDLGPHAPKKPVATTIGRFEIAVSWEQPDHPLGRITRYDVIMNSGKLIYSGLDTNCKARNLNADTEYSFTVIVITNEGKFESKPVKKRTSKNEYSDAQRMPLYTRRESTVDQPPVKEVITRRESVPNRPSKQTTLDGDKKLDNRQRRIYSAQTKTPKVLPFMPVSNNDSSNTNNSFTQPSTRPELVSIPVRTFQIPVGRPTKTPGSVVISSQPNAMTRLQTPASIVDTETPPDRKIPFRSEILASPRKSISEKPTVPVIPRRNSKEAVVSSRRSARSLRSRPSGSVKYRSNRTATRTTIGPGGDMPGAASPVMGDSSERFDRSSRRGSQEVKMTTNVMSADNCDVIAPPAGKGDAYDVIRLRNQENKDVMRPSAGFPVSVNPVKSVNKTETQLKNDLGSSLVTSVISSDQHLLEKSNHARVFGGRPSTSNPQSQHFLFPIRNSSNTKCSVDSIQILAENSQTGQHSIHFGNGNFTSERPLQFRGSSRRLRSTSGSIDDQGTAQQPNVMHSRNLIDDFPVVTSKSSLDIHRTQRPTFIGSDMTLKSRLSAANYVSQISLRNSQKLSN